MRPRILFIITTSNRGGAQKHVCSIIDGLSDQYEFVVMSGNKGFLTEHARLKGIETYIIPNLIRPVSLINDVRAYFSIRKKLECIQPDLVHTHSSKAGVLGRLVAYQLSIPSIFTAHGWAFSAGNPFSRKIVAIVAEKIISYLCEKVIAVSAYDQQLAIKYYVCQAQKIYAIVNGIDPLEKKQSAAKSTSRPFTILTIANLKKQKNLPCLIEALKKIDAEYAATIVGSGKRLDTIKSKIIDASMENRIHLAGEVEDVVPFLEQSDLFVLSSDWEGLPLSILEAMRSGLPIVSTNVGGISEAVKHGINGLLVPSKKPEELAKAIKFLMDSPERCKYMGRASEKIFKEHFSLEKMLEKTNVIYKNILYTDNTYRRF